MKRRTFAFGILFAPFAAAFHRMLPQSIPERVAIIRSGSAEATARMISQTKDDLVKKALASLTEDPDVAAEIKRIVLEQVQLALGGKWKHYGPNIIVSRKELIRGQRRLEARFYGDAT